MMDIGHLFIRWADQITVNGRIKKGLLLSIDSGLSFALAIHTL